MALFQRKEPVTIANTLFTIGLSENLLIVGLGNVGKQYEKTRHNLGFACIDNFIESRSEFTPWIDKKSLKCHISTGTVDGRRVILVKPTTLMNLSGESVEAVMNFYKLSAADLTVVHDELDVKFGQIRSRTGGSSGGHNGIKSIIGKVGEDFGRIRIGIGPKEPEQIDSADFVLGKFSKEQEANLGLLKKEVTVLTTEFVYSGKLNQETRTFLV